MTLATLAAAAVLHGTVTIGPTTPVCQAGVPCSKPAAAVTLQFTGAKHAFTVRTDGRGRYTITLPPGLYAVRASAGMRIEPAQVTVRAGSHTRGFAIDTGIR
jgi:Carboxypeptidase regulatory-like domain